MKRAEARITRKRAHREWLREEGLPSGRRALRRYRRESNLHPVALNAELDLEEAGQRVAAIRAIQVRLGYHKLAAWNLISAGMLRRVQSR